VTIRPSQGPARSIPSSARKGDPRSGFAALSLIGAIALAACVPAPPAAGEVTVRPTATAVRTAAPTPVPSGPTPVPSFVRPTPTAFPTFAMYQVAPNDTLTGIARRFDTTPQTIGYWNRARYPSLDPDGPGYAPNDIQVGWELVLVPGVDIAEDEGLPTPPPATTAP
jgi:hypothetical protein